MHAQELEPKAVLQQIALPIDSEKRAAGLAVLSRLAWTADESRLGMKRLDYMRAAREHLTAAEQVSLATLPELDAAVVCLNMIQ